MFQGAEPSSPAESLWHVVKQGGKSWEEHRIITYKLIEALATREWFAAEIAGHRDLVGRLCDPQSESGERACVFRHEAVSALASRSGDDRLVGAAASGPYGTHQPEAAVAQPEVEGSA